MPTTDPGRALQPHEVRAVVARHCLPNEGADDADEVGTVGLEAEWFVVAGPAGAGATRRLALRGADGVLALVDAARDDDPVRFPGGSDDGGQPLAGGGAVTFEPGGQLEVSGARQDTLRAALAEVDAVAGCLGRAAAERDAALVAVGFDAWHELVPQQREAARYQAMARYFDARGGDGALMMRHTCALQINLDLAPAVDARWRLACLAAPLTVATFACSPSAARPRARSRRALVWEGVDATRTGSPMPSRRRTGDPTDDVVTAALAADVLLVATGPVTRAGQPGLSFGAWLADGHPEFGWPTAADLDYHLTTLFHDARARGWLEIRTVDALPAEWRAVPPVLLAGLMYDPEARAGALRALDADVGDRRVLRRRAAQHGLAEPALARLAAQVWPQALAGARRLPAGYVDARDVDRAEAYLERFTSRGRSPADDLGDLLRVDPRRALTWASEPVGAPSPS